jgi:uncharacterized membrane protein YphA (DoxX/SURF4 family)
MSFKNFDTVFIAFATRWFEPLSRIALFIIFFYFGILKLIGVSPADDLARALVDKVVGLTYFHELFIMLALFECVIGILFLIPKYTRIAVLLLFIHLPVVMSPLLLTPHEVWRSLFVPNLEGQYIIKNVALVVLGLGLVSKTEPLISSPSRKQRKK